MMKRVFFEEFESLYYFHGSSQNWSMQDFHFHNQYEIILFLNDGATLEVGSRLYHVNAGDMFLLNNKEYHRVCGAAGKEHNRYVLMFEPELLQPMSKAFEYDFAMYFDNRSSKFNHKIHLSDEKLQKTETLLRRIEKNVNSAEEDPGRVKLKISILNLIVYINEMYSFFINEQGDEPDASADSEENKEVVFKEPVLYRERIEQIKKYISSHVDEKLEMEDIAEKFFISRHYLSHYFKKETGFTLVQYITNQKMIAAKTLLLQGYTVTEVADYLAYNSDSHFIAVFKKNVGITPKQYTKKKQV